MADLGIRVDADSLVLWRGRDFKWNFENLDASQTPIPYPPGRLFFELQTGGEHNALHRVYITGATGGTYTLKCNGIDTAAIDYNDVSENPQGLAGDISDAVIGAVGAGNAVIHPVSLYPAWTLNFNLNSSKPLTEQLVNTINKTANDFFDTFDSLLGVDVEMTVTDQLNFKLVVTSRKSFDEVGVVTFAVDVTSTAVKNFFNAAAGLIGAVNAVSTDFYWNREYNIEYTGDLALTPIPPDHGQRDRTRRHQQAHRHRGARAWQGADDDLGVRDRRQHREHQDRVRRGRQGRKPREVATGLPPRG
ncbi:hypothetical protein SEA_PRIYA_6 [Mycobacterium phage Priya]|uniref:Uncharacterized protein n=1 Tax=Mycobacterium phage Priya TaxID=2250366 RepID=A0A2Z5H5N0_9CAUD|nr:hypothetical protein SEA_PRIYA_6 [Mycobacterium phage Priya]